MRTPSSVNPAPMHLLHSWERFCWTALGIRGNCEDMSVSQNQIARLTGLSRSTVSRALVNHPKISETTKKTVSEAAKKLGYCANPVVSLLTAQIRKSRLSPTTISIAYVTSFPKPQIVGTGAANYCVYYNGAKARAEALGYKLDIIWRREHAMPAERFNKILTTRGIRGVLIAPRPQALGHITMDYARFATAAIGHPLPSPKISHAIPWHSQIATLAIRKMLKLGYRRLGFAILPESDSYTNFSYSSRFALYQMQQSPKNRVPFLVKPWERRVPTRDDFAKWLDRHQPDAIVVTGDIVPNWMRELGLRIPEEIGYADLTLPAMDPLVSGMVENTGNVGACALDLVVEQLQQNSLGIPEMPKCIHVEGEWNEGKTLIKQGVN